MGLILSLAKVHMSVVLKQASEFTHILRMQNTNVDGKVKVMFALRVIKGIGRRFSNLVCKVANIDLNRRAGELNQAEMDKIADVLAKPLDYGIPKWFLNRQRCIKDGTYSQLISNNCATRPTLAPVPTLNSGDPSSKSTDPPLLDLLATPSKPTWAWPRPTPSHTLSSGDPSSKSTDLPLLDLLATPSKLTWAWPRPAPQRRKSSGDPFSANTDPPLLNLLATPSKPTWAWPRLPPVLRRRRSCSEWPSQPTAS